MEVRNATFNKFGTIDCEINHPTLGWIPYTASPNDIEKLGRAVYTEVMKGEVSEYVAPDPAPVRYPPISPRQIRLALLSVDITEAMIDEALADNASGMIEWKFASQFERNHSLIAPLAATFNLTEEQVNSLWLTAATL